MTQKKTTLKIEKEEAGKSLDKNKVVKDKEEPAMAKADPYSPVLKHGSCPKLSPKSTDKLTYEIAKNVEDNQLYIRIAGNSGGGLFSKAWVKVEDFFTLLDKEKDKVIKSAALRPAMKGGSANNCGFMSAILREIQLLEPSPASIFSHQLASGYENVKAELRALTGSSGDGSDNKPSAISKAEPDNEK
ncbi:hypothetical protein [Vibrio cortegadensis]|uniref:hypothetical protein n=1 Tax=Vibrio cortegadensis TaxID=1328770 RepID=UPI00352E7E2A